ncbi:hypothetical protein D8Y20_10875 [Mariprofundus sp. EBB-1]|nr:hypothetical protein D8Y20_10875 [Mariprofundus sp. EBB-1]
MDMDKRAKLIAMYFPQLHAIPENDEWWGEGFTDWVNVKAAQPLFEGHNQPRIPLDKNHYDQSDMDTLIWQADLAKSHGIHGFCHYHYWFDGKQLLETPTDLMLGNKDINMPFCLSWANETWSKRWDGRDHHILMKQTHPPCKERWKLHFDYLIRAWSDERAICVDGKPVFVIYRPQNIPEIENMLDYWKELAVAHGLKGLYFIFQKQYEMPKRECLKGFDAAFQFQPFEAIYSPEFDPGSIRHSTWFKMIRRLPEGAQDLLRALRSKFVNELTFYDYDRVWAEVVKVRREPDLTTYPGAFVDWDNTARYKNKATIFKGASPEKFTFWLDKLLQTMPERDIPEPFVFINAWNEWAESTYLEPDEKNQFSYLKAISDVAGSKL